MINGRHLESEVKKTNPYKYLTQGAFVEASTFYKNRSCRLAVTDLHTCMSCAGLVADSQISHRTYYKMSQNRK